MGPRGKGYWHCQCGYCGSMVVVAGQQLQAAKGRRSCGCRNKPRPKRLSGPGKPLTVRAEGSFNKLYRTYVRAARRDDRIFDLDHETFHALTTRPCYYCGAPPVARYTRGRKDAPYVCNGLDRVDSGAGYTLANVVPCCWRCNDMKGDLSMEEFIAGCQAVAAYHEDVLPGAKGA